MVLEDLRPDRRAAALRLLRDKPPPPPPAKLDAATPYGVAPVLAGSALAVQVMDAAVHAACVVLE